MLTQERLKELAHYDPDTGIFTWISVRNGVSHAGKRAGCISISDGYIYIGIDMKIYKGHRLAFLYMDGSFPDEEADHVDHVRHNNRWENLRSVTRQENLVNKTMYSNNSSGCAGVYLDKRTGRWRALISIKGRAKGLGFYGDKVDAIIARKMAEYNEGFHENHGM